MYSIVSLTLTRRQANQRAAAAAVPAVSTLFAICHSARNTDATARIGQNHSSTKSLTQCESIREQATKQDNTTQDIDKAAHFATNLNTLHRLQHQSTRHHTLEDKYDVHWDRKLGVGAFGAVYLATNKASGQHVAIKEISKSFEKDIAFQAFQREMNALWQIQKAGGHPNICSLHEHFDQSEPNEDASAGKYYVVLDLIQGGEVFNSLVSNGPFSEMDASRMFREVASALTFLHSESIVHGDLKPENLMMSTDNPSSAVIKVVDFGSAQTADGPTWETAGWTVGYCPPEVLDSRRRKPYMHPSMDLWAVGVILYVVLTGVHPYDLTGRGSDDDIEQAVLSKDPIPLRDSPITAHLSPSAIDLVEKLMDPNPRTRLTANEMLDHPWVRGETARKDKIAYSDKKLSTYQNFKSKLGAKVFADIIRWSDDPENCDQHGIAGTAGSRKSLIERSFQSFDSQRKATTTGSDLKSCDEVIDDTRHKLAISSGVQSKDNARKQTLSEGNQEEKMETPPLSLTGFSEVLDDCMKNRFFPKGSTIYREGDSGNSMYFINSGVVEVITKDGIAITRGPGNYFGEGALLHQDQLRSATITCKTPVHAMEIAREDFNKYLAASDSSELLLMLKEKDKIRKKNRARASLRLNKNLVEREYSSGENLFVVGQNQDDLYLIEYGQVDVLIDGHLVFSAKPGNLCGEFGVLSGKPSNCSAICSTQDGCIVQLMKGSDFRQLVESSPYIHESIRELSHRRNFKKAVVKRLQKEFPYENPREAFDAVLAGNYDKDYLDMKTIGSLMRELDPSYTNDEIRAIVAVLDLNDSGNVTFEEFRKVFIANIHTSAAM